MNKKCPFCGQTGGHYPICNYEGSFTQALNNLHEAVDDWKKAIRNEMTRLVDKWTGRTKDDENYL